MRETILSTRKLSKTYVADGVQAHVLGSVGLDLYQGDFTSIMGPSGSGKSTLLYCLSGMDAPTSGEVIFEGEDIARLGQGRLSELRAQRFGFVFQAANLVSNLTLYENIAVPGYLKRGRSASETKRATDELVARMGLAQVASHLPSQASGGQKQRCAVARALITQPEIILADEPTGALDSKTGRHVLGILQQLYREGTTILLITHDDGIAATAPRVVRLSDGKIISDKHQEVDWL